MDAKIQKEYVMTVGTNSGTAKEIDLDKAVLKLEQLANSQLDVRFHIFPKEK